MSKLEFKFRPSETRGNADHGWLKTFHTFSFASWQDDDYDNFGALRVINEDRVAPKQGFPTHPHREAEIFSYIVSGELSHKDSMGNVETMKRGDVQMTSGGTGIRHSEYNDHKTEGVHFLQIWALPNQRGLPPKYYTRHFTDDDKRDKWAHLVAPVTAEGFNVDDQREGAGPTPIHSPVHVHAGLLSPSKALVYSLLPRTAAQKWPSAINFSATNPSPNGKLVYVQLVQTSGYNTRSASRETTGKNAVFRVSGEGGKAILGEGDGVFIQGGKEGDQLKVENVGGVDGEILVFEMDA